MRTLPALLAVLVACGATMMLALGARDITHTMEGVALTTAQETWVARHDGDVTSALVTYHDGRPRIQKPPLVAWIDWMAWAGLDPATADADELVWRARVVAVLMGLLTLAAIGWIGVTLGDARLAVIAAAVAGTMIFFQRQSRTASFDIHVTAWVTLAAAGGLWAMYGAGRRARVGARAGTSIGRGSGAGRGAWVGWIACALGTLGGLMSKNPLAALFVIIPLVSALLVRAGGRRRHLAGLAFALGAAAVIPAAWYALVISRFEGLDAALVRELQQPRTDPQPWYYYIGLLGLVAPWSIWLGAGLLHPFTRNVGSDRRRVLIPWLWLVITLVIMSVPGAKQQRYILPVVPAAALLIAFVWRDTEECAARHRTDGGMRAVGNAHWCGLAVAGPLLAFALGAPERVVEWGARITGGAVDPEAPAFVGAIGGLGATLLAVVLIAIALLGWRAHRHWKMTSAALATALWALVACAAFWPAYGRAASGINKYRADAESFRARTAGARAGFLVSPDLMTAPIGDEFRFYYGRPIPRVERKELASFLDRDPERVYVLAADDRVTADLLGSFDLVRAWEQRLGGDRAWRVWQPAGAVAPGGGTDGGTEDGSPDSPE